MIICKVKDKYGWQGEKVTLLCEMKGNDTFCLTSKPFHNPHSHLIYC